MKIFVINSGSSSIKYQLIQMPEEQVICSGMVDRIGLDESRIDYKAFLPKGKIARSETKAINSHSEGLRLVAEYLTDPEIGVISDPRQVEAVGHRVVHGGEKIRQHPAYQFGCQGKNQGAFSTCPLTQSCEFSGY